MSPPRLENFDVKNRTVFVLNDLGRVVLHPEHHKSITYELLPTLELLFERGAKVIIASHVGSPQNSGDKNHSLAEATQVLSKALSRELEFVSGSINVTAKKAASLKPGDGMVIENLLSFKGELKHDHLFAESIAGFCDLFVNDSLESSNHRYATTTHLPKLIESCGGIALHRQYEVIKKLHEPASNPLMLLLGGVSLKEKLKLIKKLQKRVRLVAVGGSLPYTFMKSRAINVGNSMVEPELQVEAFQVIERLELDNIKFEMPIDHVVAEHFSSRTSTKTVGKTAIPPNFSAFDIGPKTVDLYTKMAKKAGSIFWYGPMGALEIEKFRKGSESLAKALGKLKIPVVIAGESCCLTLAEKNYKNRPLFASSGAGALALLMEEELPGLTALLK